METCNEIHQQQLPEDVIIEILFRLSVKSLIRARVVSKSWYTIIKNPSFITKHSNHHSNSGRLLVHGVDSISKKYVFSLFPDETLAGSPPVYQNAVVDTPDNLKVSPYNGILCLFNSNSNRFALWNPATREFWSVPALPRKHPPKFKLGSFRDAFGFGLDPITNDYKVVWIQWTTEVIEFRLCRVYTVAVYTLSTDSWRYLDDVGLLDYKLLNPCSNSCINGVCHWIAKDSDNKLVILSFDMGNELFHEMHDIPNSEPVVLALYDNSLALIYYDSSQVDIWVMMEEGCWRKQLTIELPSEHGLLLEFWKNGQLFLETKNDGVVLYDPKTHEIKDLPVQVRFPKAWVYRETLVAIRGGDRFLEQDQLSDRDQVLNFSKTDFN